MTALSADDLTARAMALVQDQSGSLTAEAAQAALREALATYDLDRPREVVTDLIGDGGHDLPLPADFADGYSRIIAVEYPVGRRPPVYLYPAAWSLYRQPDGVRLRFLTLTPADGDPVRVTYTTRHTIAGLDGAEATTIPAWHAEAVVALTAARLLTRLANRFLHEQEVTISADSVDRQAKSDMARRRASELERTYRSMITTGDTAGGMVLDWDARYSAPDRRALTHGGR